ncbi:MAG: hypothetical protein HC811_12325 [Flammeovirgaceae bacterium]|nr:hypothetical protein [Flammeovirgaceae bacterium]
MKYLIILLGGLFVSIASTAQDASDEQADVPPGWWLIPKTKTQMKIGGYVKLDLIHDFNPIGSPDYFDVSKIPTDGSEGKSTHLHAKETRLFLDTRTQTQIGEIRTYVEGDFYGSGGAFRLRHAFVDINDKWLAGQWWSNFMDESMIPATLDFEKPGAYAFARHAMFRWKQKFSNDAYLAIAVEEPSVLAQTPSQPGSFESPLPDITARYRITKGWGHVQLSAFAGALRYRFTAGGTDDVSLFGGNLSGQVKFLKKDYLIYQIVYGPGIGRMRGGLSAGLDANGNLEALTDMGITLGVQHFWIPSLSTLVVYNQGGLDNTAGQPGSDIYRVNYIAANLIWHFTDRAFAGVEYLHGTRENINQQRGDANRIQFSVKYAFN